ncbi:DUF11 domain-containing protein [bacterium]|nr:DUF11 domain-containing protein [bacterium]
MKRTILKLLAVALLVLGAASGATAVGTAAGDSVANGYYTATDTIPQAEGRLSIAYVASNLPADTLYKGPASNVSQTVDTGYDLALLNTPSDNNAAKARDTISFGYGITNLGNATLTMDLAAAFETIGSDTNWGAGAYKVFSDANNNGVWENGDVEITTLTLAADAVDTVVVVVLVPVTAIENDSSGTRFFVTDRAPRVGASVTGDLWENGGPIAGNDARDTQYDTVATRVVGPNVRVDKTQVLASGRARPGDTIVYAITFDNDGSDSANNIAIYDAISMNATYVPNSADSAELVGTNQGFVTSFEDTFSGSVFNDTGNTSAKVIRWSLSQPLGVTTGDNGSTVDFTGNNDAGRVYFKARIN